MGIFTAKEPLGRVAVLYSRSSTWLGNSHQLHDLEEPVSYPSSPVCPSANGNDNNHCIVGKTEQGTVTFSSLQWQKMSSERGTDEVVLFVLRLRFQKGTVGQAPCRNVAGRDSFSPRELADERDPAQRGRNGTQSRETGPCSAEHRQKIPRCECLWVGWQSRQSHLLPPSLSPESKP